MGFEYKVMLFDRNVLDKVTCDKCGKEIKKESEGGWNAFGEPHTKFHEPTFECFFELEQRWGFSSKKDGEIHTAVICEACYDALFKDVKISIKRYM